MCVFFDWYMGFFNKKQVIFEKKGVGWGGGGVSPPFFRGNKCFFLVFVVAGGGQKKPPESLLALFRRARIFRINANLRLKLENYILFTEIYGF